MSAGSVSLNRIVARKKSALRPTTIALYASIFMVIVSIVAAGYKAPQSSSVASVNMVASDMNDQQTSVNQVVATTIAADVAESARLPVATNVANLTVSLIAKNEVATTDTVESVSKQQIVQPTGDRRTPVTYVTKSGDTVEKVASEYGVSKTTIMWENDLTSEALDKNKKLTILPVDGILHKVEKGDTPEKLAKKYHASEQRIVAFNNLELADMKNGQEIIVPAGKLPETERPGYVAPAVPDYTGSGAATTSPTNNGGSSNFMSGSVGNKYAFGYCTWYAYERRASMGKPIGSFWGNANTWATAASGQGFTVNSTPSAGAIFQTSAGGGGYGHVGIIDSVDQAAGTVTYSDMNGSAGWNRIGGGTIPISQAQAQWMFIH